MFLTREEIEGLTGYKTGKRQCQWLADNGYRFDVRADGRPALSREHYASRHATPSRRPSAMNLAALDDVR